MPHLLLVVAVTSAVLGAIFVVAGSVAFGRRHLLPGASGLLLGALFGTVAALAATIAAATQGYRALTREEVVATVRVQPTAPARFRATFQFADGRTDAFDLCGDQLQVDAHILKWKPVVNVLGLHTAYELDRVAGRYRELDAERDSARTVFSLAADKPLNMFHLREKWSFLAPFLDAEYGSGTFQNVDRPATFEVRLSTTGLLIRRDQG
jgi:hypothetical protein